MTLRQWVETVLADRVLQLIGVAFGGGGIAHFWTWLRGSGEQFQGALATGDVVAAVPEAVAYAQTHPAYLLAMLAGTLLVARRP